jgi:hypothetical protein
VFLDLDVPAILLRNPKKVMMNAKYLAVIAWAMTLLLVGCSRPPQTAAPDASKAAPPSAGKAQAPAKASMTASPQAAAVPTPEVTEWNLASTVVSILDKAHHTGSVVERCQCGPHSRLVQIYTFHAPVTLEPMPAALTEISKRYPDIQWREAGEGHVRVVDNSARAGLLKVRVKEFLVVEDRPPKAALAALWKTDEVAAFMAKRHVQFARQSAGSAPPEAKHKTTVIHLKNATVQEIMDRILDSYPTSAGSGLHKVWVYRECQRGAETLVEIRVL